MNRRGHQSVKIPNVKLRPAPAPTAGSSRTRTRHRQSSPLNALDDELRRRVLEEAEAEEASHVVLDGSSKPWAGIVITFTGVDNKLRLTELVKELGGEVENALTITVTHVVAVGFKSPKYLYAVEHRLPVMTPAWIIDSHTAWLRGEELDVLGGQAGYKLSPFSGLKIAISGIEPLERRKQLVSYITQSGGIYSKDLDRTCTHLVSAKATSDSRSSEKVKWALKEIQDREVARRRGKKFPDDDIRIVYEEWIWDCVAFAGRWKEESYDASKPRRRGRVTAEDVLSGKAFDVPKVEEKQAEEAENVQPAVLKKRKREQMDLVGDIISTAAKRQPDENSRAHSPVLKHEPPVEDVQQPQLADKGARRPTEVEQKPSILHTSRQTSFTAGPSARPNEADVKQADVRDQGIPAGPEPRQFFAGLRFTHNIVDEDCAGLERAIELHGGTVVAGGPTADADYLIIRLRSNSAAGSSHRPARPRVVTECWVEGCCFEQTLLSPDDNVVFQPLPAPMPIYGADKLLVHLSGFSIPDGVYLRRLLKAIGGQLSVKLNRQTTHLVCAQPFGQKYDKAHEWGVTVVRDSWLFAMARSGCLEPESAHRHDARLPPTNRALAKLAGKSSISGMSVVSELNDAMDYSRAKPERSAIKAVASMDQPRGSSQASNLSPSRLLKLTPTHIDDGIAEQPAAVNTRASSSSAVPEVPAAAHPLSPPKTETMRRLNQAAPLGSPSLPNMANMDVKATAPSDVHDDPHLVRTTSAPVASEPLPRRSNPFAKAISTSGRIERTATAQGQSTTEMLRLLAEREDDSPSPRGKLVRRSRPSGASAGASRSRLRSTGTSASPGTPASASASASAPASASASASVFADQIREEEERQLEVQVDVPEEGMGMGMGTEHGTAGAAGAAADAEESMRVMYVDHEAARTKRKLMEAVLRGSRGEVAGK